MSGLATTAQGQLYGLSTSPNAPGSLYKINIGTGAATLVATVTGAGCTSLVGIDFLGSTLYGCDVNVTCAGLTFGTINIATGEFTGLSDQAGDANWHGLAGSANEGILYAVSQDGAYVLKSITPYGDISVIGNTTIAGRGLAYDGNTNTLYAIGNVNDNNLYRLNTTTAVATLVGPLGVGSVCDQAGLAFDPFTDTLFLNSGVTNALYIVNTSTGAATVVGPNSAGPSLMIDGLGFLDCTDYSSLEENDSCGAAVLLPFASFGALDVAKSDTDWYRIQVPGSSALTINAFFSHVLGDINLKLYKDCAGSLLASGISLNDDEQIVWTNPSLVVSEVYLNVYVDTNSAIDCNKYGLTWWTTASPMPQPKWIHR